MKKLLSILLLLLSHESYSQALSFAICQDTVGYTISESSANFNGTVDHSLSSGYNLVPNTPATKKVQTEPQIKWDLESDWNTGVNHVMEANVNYQGADGTVRRPFGIFIDRATNNIEWWMRSGAQQTLMFSQNGYPTFGNTYDANGVLDIAGIRTFQSYGYGVYNSPVITSLSKDVYGFENNPIMTAADGRAAVSMAINGIVTGNAGQYKNIYSVYVGGVTKMGAFSIPKAYGVYIEAPTLGDYNYPLTIAGGTSLFGGAIKYTSQITNADSQTLVPKGYVDSLVNFLQSQINALKK